MGLSHNELYEPSKHFKQRLKQRFNVSDWEPFMRKCYGMMQKDEERTQWATPPTTAYTLNQPVVHAGKTYHPVILLDETEHKLLTIYHDMNKMEDEIEQHMKVKDIVSQQLNTEDMVLEPSNSNDYEQAPQSVVIPNQPNDSAMQTQPYGYGISDYDISGITFDDDIIEDTVEDTITDELDAFAKQLHQEQDEFRKKCEYKYAQKVLQQYQDIFDSFIHNYQRILTGNATQQNQQLMSEFKTLIEPINAIIQNLELK